MDDLINGQNELMQAMEKMYSNVKSYQCNILLQDLEKISKFWTIEDIADNSIDMSSEDHYCLTQHKAETTRQKDGRYVVRLPLKPEIKEELGESKHKAVAQFLQLEKKFVKQQEMAKNYKSFISEYVELGHMRPVAECNKTPNYFLPHHCVQRADSTTTVTYGTKAAPFLAMMTLKQLAADEGQKYPEAAKILEQDFYMDDLLSNAHSVDKTQILQKVLVALLRAGGFNLRKWCSNSYDLLEGASIVSSSQQAFDFKHLESTKTLGLRWNPHEDTFSFQLKIDTEPKSKPKTVRSKRSCNLIIFATMLLGLVAPARCDYSFTGLSSNQSLYFDNVANMRLIKEDWKLIDLDPYWQGLKLLSNCITNLQTLCAGARKQSQCDVVLLQLRHDASEIEYYNNVMLGQQLASSRQRQRRGLINGIGNLANTLFGVLDNKFAEQYENDINLIRDNQKHLALLWKNQTSVVEAEYNMLKRVEQTIEKQNKMLNQHINKLEMENNALTKQVINVEHTMEFTLSSMIATNILSNLKSVQEMLLETITDIHHGIFNIHLLHPDQLKSELNSISGHLTKDLAIPIDNIETDLQSIYHLLKVKARITKLYFIFEIKIPLVSRDNLEIYKLIAVPQQRGRDMVRLKPIADHLAINLKMDSYIPVTENELQNCIRYDSSTYLCHLQTPVYYMQSDKSLCIRDQNADQCETERTTCKETWTQLYKLNMYLYFCCDHCKIKIMCQNQIEIKQFSNAGVITLGDGCILKSDKLTIVAHRQQSNQLKIKPNLVSFEVPPINNIVNLTIPTYESKNTLNDTSSDLQSDLRVIGKQIEQMKVSEVNGVLADRVTSHDVHQFIVLYILLGAFLVAGALLTWRRLRKRFGARLQPLQPPSPPNERPIPLTAQYAIPNVPVRSNTDTNNHSTAIQAGTSSTRALDRRAKAIITKKRYI